MVEIRGVGHMVIEWHGNSGVARRRGVEEEQIPPPSTDDEGTRKTPAMRLFDDYIMTETRGIRNGMELAE